MTANQPIYTAGIYLRLSKDDETEGESSSISTQRCILLEFAKAHGITVKEEYIDDGYSGTNYDRPAFKRLISDIENGSINCVITKDLSRLGRNSAKTSDLLDEYFPSRGVRYIAVIEGYDTLSLTGGSAMTAPFMLLMNEMYARDISSKIRSSFRAKMEKGEYIGSFAPYGYKKDIEHENKNHLVVDYRVSFIVQQIFQMAYEGYAPKAIADTLNQKGIATPAVYRCLSSPYLNFDNYGKQNKWTSSSVCKMLKNRVYLGHTQQGKTTKVSFKSRSVRSNCRDDWIEVKNTHEPLITEEVYETVKNRSVARRNRPNQGFVNIFSGIAKCADCGKNMTTVPSRKNGSPHNLACGGYKSGGVQTCSNHFVNYDILYDTILKEITFFLSLADKDYILEELGKGLTDAKSKTEINADLSKAENRLQKVERLIKKAYEDFCFGIISEGLYKKLSVGYESEYKSLEKSISAIKSKLQCDIPQKNSYNDYFALTNKITAEKKLPSLLLKMLIERIEIEQGYYKKDESGKRIKHQRIKIYYRFSYGAE